MSRGYRSFVATNNVASACNLEDWCRFESVIHLATSWGFGPIVVVTMSILDNLPDSSSLRRLMIVETFEVHSDQCFFNRRVNPPLLPLENQTL